MEPDGMPDLVLSDMEQPAAASAYPSTPPQGLCENFGECYQCLKWKKQHEYGMECDFVTCATLV